MGGFNFDPRAPEHVVYTEPSPRRVRVVLGGQTVAEAVRGLLCFVDKRVELTVVDPERT